MNINRFAQIMLILCCVMFVTSCRSKKNMAKSTTTVPAVEEAVESEPLWQTCLIQNAKASVRMGDDKISANATMQVVRDSMLVISVMPFAGMELVRFEATPTELIGFNKLDGTYAVTTYDELNRQLTPKLNWETLQQLCSAELPTGNEKARMVYTLGKKSVEINITYPERMTDVPVRVKHLPTNRYKKIDISKWL